MTAPLSQDLRKRLFRAAEEGVSAREAAARFAVSASATLKLVWWVRQTGSTAPAKIGGYRKPLLAFLAYVGLLLAAVLAKGDVLVLNNLPAHKAAGIREAIRATGASLLYLPPYSPDVTPIEQPSQR